jgi:glucose/arabinose dehydrogenase/azurin/lysophospholipase L1-like esterase
MSSPSARPFLAMLRPHLTVLAWLFATSALPAAEAVNLAPGEHVAIIGNALADRMQHHGWLETMMHQQHPQHRLVVRNLAFSGDEVAVRPRSQDFGTPDQWLTRVQASTIFAFFGFNESFRGPAGLPQFKQELEQFLRTTRAKNYNGLGPPRIVLFSPIANEAHPNPDLRLPPENNANLALYTAAMAEVARDMDGVTFVDLFAPSQQLFAAAARNGEPPLTFNGVHLTEAGEAKLAAVMFPALFGGTKPPPIEPTLRAAVNAKNAMWHTRYRSLDGYNTYGGRSANHLYFGGEGRPKLTNAQVLQEEFAQRDVLTTNRDLDVWSIAQGRGPAGEKLPLPPVTPVPTSKPGPNPDGSHVFLGAEDAIAKMTLHPGLRVNLFASEAQFPELRKPVQMAWDTRGRLWVATWPNYPLRRPDSQEGDRLVILEDTDGDGRADKCTTFLDDLDCPTGFQFYKDGVLLVQAPDLWYIRDTDGDDRADSKERVLMGLDSADTHHQANSLSYDPGGAVYLSDGVFHRTQVETAEGPVRNLDAAIYRYEPRTQRFETYVAYGFANPHGRSFDRWGNDLITDATGNRTYFGPAFSGRLDYPAKHATLKPFWPNPSRPSAASTILSSRHFPDDFQGNFLNGNVIRFQGVYRVKVVDDGAGYKGEQLTDFLSSSDPNFRPTGIDVGPDGAVYLLDWHSPIIAHTNLNHLRDPNRGFEYGRVYRISHQERPLLAPPKIHDQPIPALLELLKAHEYRTRELAKIELDRHDRSAVITALKEWIRRLDPRHPDYQHHLMEALWVHQWQNVVDVPLLERMLRSPEPEARAAATRVLCYWRERVPHALSLLRTQAGDEHPRVRLHAVRAASFFRSTEAVDVALSAIRRPLDYYLEYTLDATLRQLTPHWRDQLLPGRPLLAGDPKRINHLLRTVTNEALLQLPRTREVLETIMIRPGLADSARAEAMGELAALRRTTPTAVLLGQLEAGEKVDLPAFGRLLIAQPRADLAAARPRIAARTQQSDPAGRSAYWAALVIADGGFDAVWREAEGAPKAFADLLAGIPLIGDATLRATAYPRLAALLAPPAGSPAPAAAVRQAAIRAAVSTRQDMPGQFQVLSGFIQRGEEIPVAAEGIRGLVRTSWNNAAAPALATALVGWAKKSPENVRRGAGFLGVTQLAEELATRLPAADAASIRMELAGLRTATFLVRAVPEEMRFDVARLVVEHGKVFSIVFENPDAMPHNLVVVKPGTREKVGQAALELRADYVDRLGRAFVPDTSDVIAATKLLDPGQTATIRVDAPLAEGEYEYVCTFPGHWVTMWGKLIITSNPEAVLAAPATPAPAAAAPGHHHGSR